MKSNFLLPWPGFDPVSNSNSGAITDFGPSLTSQEFAEECDINTIAYRYGLTGVLPTGIVAPSFGDFTGVNDYQTALSVIKSADEAFMTLPANVRSRFDNDPQSFIAFCDDDKNRAEAETLGLVFPKGPGPVPNPVPPV